MKKLKKTTMMLMTAAIASSLTTPVAHSQSLFTTSNQCSDVHLIVAKGTGSSNEYQSTAVDKNFDSTFANKVLDAFPGKVTGYQIAYPASAGALYSVTPQAGSATTYGESRLRGVARGLKHIEEYSKSCPNAAYAFYGYSQGASVAGDITALLANGAVKGVDKDKILGTVLMADPGRSGHSQYSGPQQSTKHWMPIPQGAKYQRNGEVVIMPTQDSNDSVGMTGQRSLGFNGIEGRVLSFCVDGDIACSVPSGHNIIRDAADYSDKDIKPNIGYTFGRTLMFISLLNIPTAIRTVVDMFKGLIMGGLSIDGAVNAARASVEKDTQMSALDKMVIYNALTEAKTLVSMLKRDDVYGSGVTDAQIVAHIIGSGGPAAKQFLPPQLKQYEPQIDQAIAAATAISLTIPLDKRGRADKYIRGIASFPSEHAQYFGKYQINGKSANDFAADTMITGVDNYLKGAALNLNIGPNPSNGTREVAEADRKPDGLESFLANGYGDYIITQQDLARRIANGELDALQGVEKEEINVPEERFYEKNDPASNSEPQTESTSTPSTNTASGSTRASYKSSTSASSTRRTSSAQTTTPDTSIPSTTTTQSSQDEEFLRNLAQVFESTTTEQTTEEALPTERETVNRVYDSSRSIGQVSQSSPTTTQSSAGSNVKTVEKVAAAKAVGPQVDTGGQVEKGVFSTIAQWIRG